MLHECKNCGTLHQSQQKAIDCCYDSERLISIEGMDKKQFIDKIIKIQEQLKEESITKKDFQGMITPLQYGEFLWETLKRFGPQTQQQIRHHSSLFLRNTVMQSLQKKGLLQLTNIREDGEALFGLTKLGKEVRRQLVKKQEKVYEFFKNKQNHQ